MEGHSAGYLAIEYGSNKKRASQVTPNLFTTENGKSYRYSLIEMTWVSFPQLKVWLKGG